MSVFTRFTTPKPKIARVRADGLYILNVDWEAGPRAGASDRIDLEPVVISYKIFRPLRNNRAVFQTAARSEYGTAVQWANDDDLQISASTLQRLAEETLTADQFREFLRAYRLTHGVAAAELGRSRRAVENYLAGEAIPRVVVMACYGYAARRLGMRGLLPPNQTVVTPLQIITETSGSTIQNVGVDVSQPATSAA